MKTQYLTGRARVLEPVIQDKNRWWSWEDLLVLVLFGVLFFLPGLGQIGLFDRDEPRFATAAREMAARHDFIVPYFNGNLRPDKPPLVYWLMNAVHQVTGTWSELTVRLPSAICGTLTLLVVYFMVGKRFGRMTALLAGLMLGSCGTFVAESRLATADATMLFFITVCMSCAWTAWEADWEEIVHGGVALVFWVALALGTLAKGVPLIFVLVPMAVLSIATGAMAAHVKQWRSHLHVTRMRMGIALGIGVVASGILAGTMHVMGTELRVLTVVLGVLFVGMALTPGLPGVAWRCVTGGNWRWWGQLRPMWGVPLLVVLIGAWAVPAGMRAPDLLKQMVGIHFLQRAVGPLLTMLHINMHALAKAGGNTDVANYSQPPGFFLVTVWVTFWPWSVLLIPAGYFTWRRLRGRTAIAIDPKPYQFLVAWIVPLWVLLEAARGKLLHYTLPAYVGLAILCADAMVQSWDRMTDVLAAKWFARVRWLVLGIWCGIGAAVVIGAQQVLAPEMFWPCVLLGALFVAAGCAGTIAWNRPSWPFVTVLGWGAALLFMNHVVVPQMGELRVSERVAAKMVEIQNREPEFHLAAVGESKFPPVVEGGNEIKFPGYQEPTLVYYSDAHVRMEFPSDRDISVDDMLRVIPFAPEHVPAEDEKYLIAVDQPTLEYLQHRKPGVEFYQLGRYAGIDSANLRPIVVTVISNVLPK